MGDLVNYEKTDRENLGLEVPPKGKHVFGMVKVGDKGQIVIPANARKIFDIQPGDNLLILGDEEQGIAILKEKSFLEHLRFHITDTCRKSGYRFFGSSPGCSCIDRTSDKIICSLQTYLPYRLLQHSESSKMAVCSSVKASRRFAGFPPLAQIVLDGYSLFGDCRRREC